MFFSYYLSHYWSVEAITDFFKKLLQLLVMVSMAIKLWTLFKMEQNKILREAFCKCKAGIKAWFKEVKTRFLHGQIN